jgi:hypothetical protein
MSWHHDEFGDPKTGDPGFTEVDIDMEPAGRGWRLTVVNVASGDLIATDTYPNRMLADQRARDFEHDLHNHAPTVKINRLWRRWW